MEVKTGLILFLVFMILQRGEGQLSETFYQTTCPKLESIVRKVVTQKINQTFVTVPATLRLFFHDCFVEGCDASILIASPNGDAEKDAPDNLSLAGDGFDTVIKAKQAVEKRCPGLVSCADILAIATRDIIDLAGGPSFKVELGRRDGLISQASRVAGNLPEPNFNLTQLDTIFAKNSLTQIDMIALSGCHTVGFSHCNRFASRLYSFSPSSPVDPDLDPTYAQELKQACPQDVDARIAINMDPITPQTFDNMYFQNLVAKKGLFTSDEVLFTNPASQPTVIDFAKNPGDFNAAFITAMRKLGRVGVKTGQAGQIRSGEGRLSQSFYNTTCPILESIVRKVVEEKVNQTFVTVPATLRLFFHDCFVEGCDASIMIASPNGDAEKDAPDNLSLAGDGFDTVIKAKQAVEAKCPGVVSCADILVIAARDVVRLAGGPSFKIQLGRRDGLVSQASRVAGNLPEPNFDLTQLNTLFAKNNLTQTDMIALSGAHTLGFSHCSRFANRLYSFSPSSPVDPDLDPTYVQQLKEDCPQDVDPRIAIDMDPVTPQIFDNMYFKNLIAKKGLFTSDDVLFTNPASKPTVMNFAGNQEL
ncbi:Peroxidase superfamily protein [Theobroma cacao]|uniref:peroxidase n=1 Tax=Theobroma cacao TaxID=3641 RepID=A0A061EEJ3_THECC|nr:Peroxidase superfamily protein [Theobroma cacao]